MSLKTLFLPALVLVTTSAHTVAAPVTFKDVKVRCANSNKDPRLTLRDVELVFDDAARTISVKGYNGISSPIPYDEIVNVVDETTTHKKGGRHGDRLGGRPDSCGRRRQPPGNLALALHPDEARSADRKVRS